MVFPFAVLWATETAMRRMDVGTPTEVALASKRNPSGTSWYLNPRVDVVCCASDLRGPEPRAFELPKPVSSYRIVVVGASSVQGYPYSSEIAFPRQLQLALLKQDPSRTIEVLNAGIVGVSTTPLADLVSRLPQIDPDLIIVYAGHNEFYGVGGVATNANASRIGILTRRFRLGQLITNLLSPADADAKSNASELISRLPGTHHIPVSSELMEVAESRYRSNLNQMCRSAQAAGIPLLLCSVVCNLHDQSPARTATVEETASFERMITDEHAQNGDEGVCRVLQRLTQDTPEDAVPHYRLAQCLERLGRVAEAAEAYRLARDLDLCRYRAPGSYRDIVRDVAANAGSGVHFVDLVPVFAEHSKLAAPGNDLFLEHVHLSVDGHWLVARSLAQSIVEDVWQSAWSATAVPNPDERDEWLGVIPEDHLVGAKLAFFINETPPFDGAIDAVEQGRRLDQRYQNLRGNLTEDELTPFLSLPHQTQIDDLVDGLGRYHLGQGNIPKALNYFEISVRRRPWMPNGYVFHAVCSHLMGDDAAARKYLEQSRQTVMPESAPLIRDRNRLMRELSSFNSL
ncbi:MAG: tetratricopeptide repeat protein [Planctomycetaceae bacterium]|nr:tetratricopeptide repeat protein [Planctomycetaceae bacterium]